MGGTVESVGSAPRQWPNMDVIKELWQRSSEGLTTDKRLWQLLEEFPDVFAASVAECTCTDLDEVFVHCCDTCTARKGQGERPHAPLQLLQSGAAMERVTVDCLGPFPETESRNRANGLVERFNATLTTQLAMLTVQHQGNWDLHLPLVLLSCRFAVQESMGFMPAMLMFGHELHTPVDLVFGTPPRTEKFPENYTEFIRELAKRMDSVHGLCREQQCKASVRQNARLTCAAGGRLSKSGW
ncbi:hypothetical protein NFI96_030253, partial [Prochilodus magdalenae]